MTSEKKTAKDFQQLSHQIIHLLSLKYPRTKFMKHISRLLYDMASCDAIELWILHEDRLNCEIVRSMKHTYQFEIFPYPFNKEDNSLSSRKINDMYLRLFEHVVEKGFYNDKPFITDKGSLWTRDLEDADFIEFLGQKDIKSSGKLFGERVKSIVIIPLKVGNEKAGFLLLTSKMKYLFTEYDIKLWEDFSETLVITLINQRAQAALQERMKELTCLYGISKLVENPGIQLNEILMGVVELLPPSWQYPEITCGRIVLDNQQYKTKNYQKSRQKQITDIIVNGEKRGIVEVSYTKRMPKLDEGPFLQEERNLIDTVAKQIALIVERRETAEEKRKLEEQLRHADRLATIGQLSAGIAHELNEPLGSILGFTQLLKKNEFIPEESLQDLLRIENASLHAREVIKKLMLFARQMPPKRTSVNLNKIVEEGLYFLESRCAKQGIEVNRVLSSNLPEITADASQLHQVLVNLEVNAIQAMPDGGKLTIQTSLEKDRVCLSIFDTGTGMDEDIKRQIFIPFFTTKDIGEGTGIGLSVVHGIVTSHEGHIKVKSKIGAGSRFDVFLPVHGQKKEKGK